MPHFRKKAIVIEARQLGQGKDENAGIVQWAGARVADGNVVIPTLEGDHIANIGDWIIRGIKGEFYPCKPDIFAASYEPAEAPAHA